MRQWINATSLLMESGLINTNRKFVFRWKCEDGHDTTYVLVSAKDDLMQLGPNDQIGSWLSTVFLNWLKKNAEELKIFGSVLTVNETLDYVADLAWGLVSVPEPSLYGVGDLSDERLVNALRAQLPEWAREGEVLLPYGAEVLLTRLDDLDAPFKLSEIFDYFEARLAAGQSIERISVPDAVQQSNAWHAQRVKSSKEDVEGQDIVTVMNFPDGYRIVQLLTPAALDRESHLCGHCVGKGGYDRALLRGDLRIFSLRDANNHPHATLEVVGKEIRQVKGYGNGHVPAASHVLQFIAAAGLSLRADHKNIGITKVDLDA